MSAGELLKRAAALLQSPDNYSRHAKGSVFNPDTDCFSATGLLERANTVGSNSVMLHPRDNDTLDNAKTALCRKLGVAHLSVWEWADRPDWQEIKALLLEAAA